MESPVSRIFNPASQNIHARFKEEEITVKRLV
jgi:hypothetical protein